MKRYLFALNTLARCTSWCLAVHGFAHGGSGSALRIYPATEARPSPTPFSLPFAQRRGGLGRGALMETKQAATCPVVANTDADCGRICPGSRCLCNPALLQKQTAFLLEPCPGKSLPTSPCAARKGRGWAAQRIRRWRMCSFRRSTKRRRTPCKRRPGGRRTGGAPFFDAAGCRIEKSRPCRRRQICLGTRNFSLVTFLTRAYGARPSGRLRRSRRKRRSTTKKVTRAKRGSSAVAI